MVKSVKYNTPPIYWRVSEKNLLNQSRKGREKMIHIKRVTRFNMRVIFLYIIFIGLTFAFSNSKLKVICTTSDLSSMVLAIGKDKVTVNNIIPFGMCPGHSDITPREVSQIQNADLVLANGFESFLSDIISSNELKIIKLETKENLMVPANHIKTARKIAAILTDTKPDLKNFFQQNCVDYIRKINETETELLNKLTAIRNKDVICASMNKDFVEWLGGIVVAVFPRDENISLKNINDIIADARSNHPVLVIDNLQSSGKVGQSIADELTLPLIILSNFPEDNDYLKTLQHNCHKIITALPEYSHELHH
jgi:zinc transport system substrate-binding protein